LFLFVFPTVQPAVASERSRFLRGLVVQNVDGLEHQSNTA